MGQSTGALLGIAGAVVGGLTGGTGFAVEAGFLAGSLLGAILTPRKSPTPADIKVQDSAYGKYIPQVWGRYRVAGNVIWCGQPTQHDPSGKGAGGKQNQPYVTMSFAIGLCKGPITAVTRIWANGQLIYDISNPADFEGLSGSSSMITNFTVYPGDENQVADPVMQAALGVANTPPYRGMAYVVFNELSLQQWGNYLPSLSFEVVVNATPTYVTSGNVVAQSSPAFPGTPTTIICQISPAGIGYGLQWRLMGSAIGWVPITLSATGTSFPGGAPVLQGGNFPVTFGTSYDEPGFVWTDGTWRPLSGAASSFGTTLPTSALSNGSWVKRNGVIFYTYSSGLSKNPIFKVNNMMSLASLAIGSLVSAGNFSAAMRIIAASDNLVYAVGIDSSDATYGSRLLLIDHDGNFVSVLDGPNTSRWNATTAGYAISDTEVYINGGNGLVYVWNGSALVATGMPGDSSGNLTTMLPLGNQMAYFSASVHGANLYAVVLSPTGTAPTVASIVSDICSQALQPSQYDTTQLTDTLVGFARTSNSSPRDLISPLSEIFFFDTVDSGSKMKFVRRGGASALTIPVADLGADASGDGIGNVDPITLTITQEQELPRSTTMTYLSATTDYQEQVQREFRAQTLSVYDESLNVPIVMGDNDAKARVQAKLWETWIQRSTFKFATQFKYLMLEPGDVVNITGTSGQVYTVRIKHMGSDGNGVLTFEADPAVPSIYPNPSTSVTDMPQAATSLGFAKGSIPYSAQTLLEVLDLPPLRNTDTTPGLYIAAGGLSSRWPGCNVDMSRDDTSFSSLVGITNQSVIGVATSALGQYAGGNTVDEINSVSVQLYDDDLELSSISYASMLNGGNACLLGGELMYFRNAVLTAPGTYTLSGFVRGRQGTEAAMATHVAGEVFVLLDPAALVAVGINITDIGQPLYFQPFLKNIFGGNPGLTVTTTPSNARVRPFPPHLLSALKGSASSVSDITLKWFRRARVNSQWVSGADVSLDQSAENYTLTISNSSGTVVRTVTVSGPFTAPAQPNYVYSAANITADGFNTGATINFRVQQNSDQGVLGVAATTSITR